jgi:hypothetical protein
MTMLKAVAALIVSAVGALVTALGPDGSLANLDTKHWLLAIATVFGSGGAVWLCENGPWHAYIKAVVAFLSGGIASLVIALNDNHITQSEWLIAFTAAVTAGVAVYQARNTIATPTA